MLKKAYLFLAIFFMLSTLQAHTLLMNIMDNEDNTITIMGEFSTGEKASGAMIRLESLSSGKILYKKRLPEDSELTVKIPQEPYQIVLDGGPNHTVVKEGIAPIGGFEKIASEDSKVQVSKENQNMTNTSAIPIQVLLGVCFVLILLTLYFSARNTKKLMAQLKK